MENVQLTEMSADQVFNPEQSETIEVTLEEFDTNFKIAEKFARLLDNQDFIDIISNGYIDAESERLGGLLTTSNRKVIEKTENIVEQIIAKRHLRTYLEYKLSEAQQYLVPGQRDELVRQMNEMDADNV